MNYWVFLASLIYIIANIKGHSVCEKEIEVPRTETEMYSVRVPCTYYESCWRRTTYLTRTKVVYVTQTEEYCCTGYTKIGQTETGSPVCEPICDPECINAKCSEPGLCDCKPGFPIKFSANLCIQNCNPKCVNAECQPGNVCACKHGYVVNEPHSCIPKCTQGCVNGYCQYPEVCACNSSYTLSPNGTVCTPICTLECVNGRCVAPDRCECNDGFVEGETWNLCSPYCSEPCENAMCTSPDVCTCFAGYNQLNETAHKCEPHCSIECINGECIAPEECGCNDGFEMEEFLHQVCVPVCTNGCDNGRCISPEKCECNNGYKDMKNSCIPHCDNECINGNCTAPNECTCNYGTIKASAYHCLMTCDDPSNDNCFHESSLIIPLALILLNDGEPFIDFPSNNSLSVPCNHLSAVESGHLQSDYQCYTYLNFEEESITVTCFVDSETMEATDSYNQTQSSHIWMANTTSMESRYMKVSFVHREISKNCTAHLCSSSNRTLNLNAISTIRVCMEQLTEGKKTGRRLWMMFSLLTSGALLLLLALLIPAVRHHDKLRKVSYIVNTRHHSTSSRLGILQEANSSENLPCEQFEAAELSDDSATEHNVES